MIDTYDVLRGQPSDGDDVIEIGDNFGGTYIFAFGQGGNDKIIGGVSSTGAEKLYGGDGDDKVWAMNPGQYE